MLAEDSSGTGSDSTASSNTHSDFVPSLAPGLNPGASQTGPVVDGAWEPFPETTGDDNRARSTSNPSLSSSSQGPVTTQVPSSSSPVTSSEESSTQPSTTGSDTSSGGTSGTSSTTLGTASGSDSQTSTGSTTGPADPSGGNPDETGDAAPVANDPMGTQFGLRVELSIAAPFTSHDDFRALVFTFDSPGTKQSLGDTETDENGDPMAHPAVSQIKLASYQPHLPFNKDGKAALILPTPLNEELNSSTRRSKPHAVTVYRDLNGDGVWNETEPFVAALPQTLSYIAASPGEAERWVQTPNAASLLNGSGEEPVQSSLTLHRLDRFRVPAKLHGQTGRLAATSDFVTMLATAEMQDLSGNFMPSTRALDLHLRALPAGKFAIQPSALPPMPRSGGPDVNIPGIRPSYTATRWLATYRRPTGTPIEAPGEFLTPDSTLINGLCVPRARKTGNVGRSSREVIALWLDDGAWATGPEGALYATWLEMGVGWNFIPIDTSMAFPWVDAASAPVSQSFIKWNLGSCSPLLR